MKKSILLFLAFLLALSIKASTQTYSENNFNEDFIKLPHIYTGIVIDNQDPAGLDRVKVKFPWLIDSDNDDGDFSTDWCRIESLSPGSPRGNFLIPEIDDEVLITYDTGEIKSPYLIGTIIRPEEEKPKKRDWIPLTPERIKKRKNLKKPVDIDEIHKEITPMLPEEYVKKFGPLRDKDLDEEKSGLDSTMVNMEHDMVILSPSRGKHKRRIIKRKAPSPTSPLYSKWLKSDMDGDCLTNAEELKLGTDYNNPDSDGDGWFDGPCNERRKIVLKKIYANDEQEDAGDDELYLIVDNTRFPNRDRDLDDYWNFDDGESHNYNLVVAERTRGINQSTQLASVRIQGWEDDFELWNSWTVDDLLFEFGIDPGAYANGDKISLNWHSSDWDYELEFQVVIEKFSDPSPLSDDDLDGDGILESSEYEVARDFGGITDPYQKDILVEVDWMNGHYLKTQAKRMVITDLYRNGFHAYIHRHQAIPAHDYLSRYEARDIYDNNFTFSQYDAFRYALMTEEIWNDASGVASGDTFIINDSTWWINGGVLAQAGTFIHELGHTMGLNQQVYYQIDTIGSFHYDSAMNYLYQATRTDYSYDGSGGSSDDHNDWEDVDAAYGLKYRFGY